MFLLIRLILVEFVTVWLKNTTFSLYGLDFDYTIQLVSLYITIDTFIFAPAFWGSKR